MTGALKKIVIGAVLLIVVLFAIIIFTAPTTEDNEKEAVNTEAESTPVEEALDAEEIAEKEILDTEIPEETKEEEPVEEKEFDPFEYPNYIMEGDTYVGLYTDRLYMNPFKNVETGDIDFNIFQFDKNDELIPEACIGGTLTLKQEDEDGNSTYIFEEGDNKLTVGYVVDTDTYFVQSQSAEGYQIEEDFVKLDYETEESDNSDNIVFLENESDVLDFFRDSSNVGKRFEVGVPFAVYNFQDYRQNLGNDIHNSYYFITFPAGETKFTACLYGWSDQPRFFTDDEIYVQGIFESNQSTNADFDIMAEYCY